ncbi:MAG TPA: hypothetical protein VLF60_03045 [Candidatus Saccharimonadales bacterium]|nr:hypothetical protein [Candidatus Saccharimonadales bacterium]
MAAKATADTYLVMPSEEASARVSGHIGTGKQLLETSVTNADELRDMRARYRKWREYGVQLLKNMFSDDSIAARLQDDSGVVYTGPDLDERYRYFRNDFLQDITTLESIEEMLSIMPKAPRNKPEEHQGQSAGTSVSQTFQGPVENVIGSSSGHADQNGTDNQTAPSDGTKWWQLFLALLGVAGTIAVAYIAHWLHWV